MKEDDLSRRVVITRFKGEAAPRAPRAAARREGNCKDYVALIKSMPSCVSGAKPCDPHHLTGGPAAKERGVAMKATDKWCLPLTRKEHDDLHRFGSRRERAWFAQHGVDDPYRLAEQLWTARSTPTRMRQILENGGE